MPPVDVEKATARNAWTSITSNVSTPEGHACVLLARRAVGRNNPVLLVQQYRRLRDEGTFAGLNGLPLSAAQIAELAIVANGAKDGVQGQCLDGHVRRYLAAHKLTAVAPGSRFPAADWRAVLYPTLRGIAVVRAAQGKPPILSAAEVMPLALIEQAMASAEGGVRTWPGSDLALRVAQTWRLVERVQQPTRRAEHWSGGLGKTVYRLTAQGVGALERYRTAHHGGGGQWVSPQTAEVLEFVAKLRTGDPGASPPLPLVIRRCIEQGWIREGAEVEDTGRRRLALTEQGIDALEGWRFRRRSAPVLEQLPTCSVRHLEKGQTVRLSNRRAYPGIDSRWVRVEEVKRARSEEDGLMKSNYEVWVSTDLVGEPFLYVGRPLFHTVRFQIKEP